MGESEDVRPGDAPHPAPPEREQHEADLLGEDAEGHEPALAHAALPPDECAEEDDADGEERVHVGHIPADERALAARGVRPEGVDGASARGDPASLVPEDEVQKRGTHFHEKLKRTMPTVPSMAPPQSNGRQRSPPPPGRTSWPSAPNAAQAMALTVGRLLVSQ